jgi:G3E family GTPase
MKQTIPVYVLSGFLGSGKTTVLLRMIEACKERNKKPAVILNELGKVNVEDHLFSEDRVNELLDGCICCTIQSNFRNVLNQLAAEKNEIDALIIEGTGVANPIELIEVLTESRYSGHFHLQSIIGVVDAARFLEYLSIFFSSSAMRKLFKDQIKCASYIVLNKTDAVSEKKLVDIEAKLRSFIASGVPVYKTTFGAVPLAEIFQKRIMTYTKPVDEDKESFRHHHAAVKAIRLENVPPLNQKRLKEWIKHLPDVVYRGKGIVRLEGKQGLYELQYASRLLHMRQMYADNDNIPASLVFIGEGDAVKGLARSFEEQFMTRTEV